jgi:hypothetical protein
MLFAVVTALLFTASHLHAATITFTFATNPGADGKLTYVTDPNGAQPAQDSFLATILSPQLGTGTVAVPNDFTNYITATGHSNLGTFTFANGTFSGSVDSVLNLMTGAAAITYHINSGTGAYLGAVGTLNESAQFTSFGTFSPNVPATAAILSGGGTLTLTPEPATAGMLALGVLGCACLRRQKQR